MKRTIVAVLSLLLVLFTCACSASPSQEQTKMLDALDFTITTLQGEGFTLSEQAGKVTFINFWATWCPPCVGELPEIQKLYEDYSADDVAFLMISVQEELETVQGFLDDNGYSFPVAIDDGTVSALYPTNGIPFTVVINKDGKISASHLGGTDYKAFSRMLDAALKE